MLESVYQGRLIKKLKRMFPGCFVFKNDPEYIQGVPDLLVLFQERWAALEVKASASSPSRPNQNYYVNELDAMSFAAFIYPENEEDVLNALQSALQPPRQTRLSKRQQTRFD